MTNLTEVVEREVVEMARFSVALDRAADLRETAAGLERWLVKQPGFLSRILVGPDEHGAYTDLVRWRCLADAQAAGGLIMGEPSAQAFMAVITPGSVEMRHAPVLLEM